MMLVFRMRDSLPSARYSPVCNVLRQWKTSLIPNNRVYRLYDYLLVYFGKTLILANLAIRSTRMHFSYLHYNISFFYLSFASMENLAHSYL